MKQNVECQRQKAAVEEVWTGWLKEATAKDRYAFIMWAVETAAGERGQDIHDSQYNMFWSTRQTQPDRMSPISITKFAEPWLRRVVDQWYYVDRHGNATNDEIKLKPQIANWDRVKGIPLKTIMKAIKLRQEEGGQETGKTT